MSKLGELIKSLKVYYIVIIENEFQYVTNPSEILGHFVDLTDGIKERIFESLPESLSEQFKEFDNAFNSVKNHNDELKSTLLPVDLEQYLSEIGKKEVLNDALIEGLSKSLENDKTDHLKEIFLRNGILHTPQVTPPIYDQIINELIKISNVQITFYKSHIPPAQRSDFELMLEKGLSETGSMFWLAIVDKMLGEGDTGEQGKDLIKYFQEIGTPFLGFILSSKAEDKEPESYQDYFLREISKGDDVLLETITQRLAEAAYAEVFFSIQNKYLASSEEALKTVLKNQKNIKHIVTKAHAEGIPPYDAIKYWFDLAVQKGVDNQEVNDFKFLGGLTSFFNDSYLGDHPSIHSISDELSELNTFELFDTNINSKHLAIAPGDIWYAHGKYYILMGQLCDLLLRENDNSRNAKLVELLEVQLTNHTEVGGDKFYIDVDNNGTKTIKVENFPDPVSNDVKMLEIKISTPTTFYADPKILDLCMFNENGECKLNFKESLPESITSVLPTNKERYYEALKFFFKPIEEIFKQGIPIYDNQILFGLNSASKADEIVDFGLKRVARLRGRYFDSLYNNFLNNKGRIDLNLIENAPETSKSVDVHIKFAGDDSHDELNNINLWERKGRHFLRKNELLGVVPDKFIDLLKVCDEEMEFGPSTKHEILQEGSLIKIELYYNMGNGNYHKKRQFSYSNLFKDNKPQSNPNFRLADGTEKSFLNDQGYPKNKITFEELEEGVFVYEHQETLEIENGCIKRIREPDE